MAPSPVTSPGVVGGAVKTSLMRRAWRSAQFVGSTKTMFRVGLRLTGSRIGPDSPGTTKMPPKIGVGPSAEGAAACRRCPHQLAGHLTALKG